MLGDTTIVPCFFFGRTIVDNLVVESILRERTGDLLEWHIKRSLSRPAPFVAEGLHVGIFPNTKTCRNAFDFEVQIIHDLSTLLTPQYHNQDTIDYHAKTVAADVETNELTVCVSDATRTDVLRYLGPLDPTKVITVYNAATVPSPSAIFKVSRGKPHILILGTIEPRKNVGEVLALLKDCPYFGDQFDFIFLGRYGWGESIDRIVEDYGLASMVEKGCLIFPGFVDNTEKNEMLRTATMLIYPSLFEGFGLPVVEAMSLGVPCLTTRSSSMPEVGGDACFYFDPFTSGSFRRTFITALLEIKQGGKALREKCKMQAAKFSWRESYRQMIEAIASRAEYRKASDGR